MSVARLARKRNHVVSLWRSLVGEAATQVQPAVELLALLESLADMEREIAVHVAGLIELPVQEGPPEEGAAWNE